jgi:hypothetical protein
LSGCIDCKVRVVWISPRTPIFYSTGFSRNHLGNLPKHAVCVWQTTVLRNGFSDQQLHHDVAATLAVSIALIAFAQICDPDGPHSAPDVPVYEGPEIHPAPERALSAVTQSALAGGRTNLRSWFLSCRASIAAS